MPANFKWQTDEEDDWVEEMEAGGATAVSLTRRVWFRPVLIASLVLILTGSVLFWQLTRRVEETTNGIEADIMASYELLAAAADQKDVELFRSLHAHTGRQTSWGYSLDKLMTNDSQLWNGRRPGITPLTDSPQVAEIILAPDLDRAELITEQSYVVQTAADVTQTLTLNWTHNYELQTDGRWLMTAPDDEFWGEWQTYESQRLRFSYPARDETVALEFAAALDEELEQLCRWSADLSTLPPCPDDWQYQVRWDQEPGSLADFGQSRDEMFYDDFDNGKFIIAMPAPTLVGTPATEAGEQILLDLYVRHTLAEIVRYGFQNAMSTNWYRFSGYNQASLHRLLTVMGVTVWPPPVIPRSDPGPPPIPWPEQAVALTCLDESGQNAALFHVQPESGRQSTVFAETGVVDVQLLSEGRLLAQVWTGTEASWQLIKPDGTAVSLPATEEPVERMYGDGRYFVAPIPASEKYAPSSGYYALDWKQCLQTDCQWRQLPGRPIWSPDGTQLVLQAWPEGDWISQVWYGKSFYGPFELVAEGDSPVWLDEATFSYRSATFSDESDAELVAVPMDGEPETIVTLAGLEAVLPAKEDDESSWFYLADAHSDLFLMTVVRFQSTPASSSRPRQKNYLLLFDGRSQETTVVAEGETVRGNFAGDGRSLILREYNYDSGIWSLSRYDIAQKQTEPLIQYNATAAAALPINLSRGSMLDWSADGQWLLIFRDGVLILLAPDYNYKHVIVPDTPGCFNAAWIAP